MHHLAFGVLVSLLTLLPGLNPPLKGLAGNLVPPASRNEIHVAQQRECSRRIGPFATQDTAWRRWREAKSQGYRVSEGIFPCRDEYGTRGYCFNVFFLC